MIDATLTGEEKISHFSFLNLAIGIITFLLWGGLFYIREKGRIKSWFLNRFIRDKIPELPPEGDKALFPFPYDELRPKKETRKPSTEEETSK